MTHRQAVWLSALVVSMTATDHIGAQEMVRSRFRASVTSTEPRIPRTVFPTPRPDTSSTRFPPASKGLIAGQVVGGIFGAVVGGLGSWYFVNAVDQHGRKTKGDEGYSPNANTAYAVGSWAGASTISYLLGQADGSHASRSSTALAAGLATLPLIIGREEPYLPIIGVVLVAPLQSAFAAIGYHKTRRGPR